MRFLNGIDEFTREAFATHAARSFTADATVAVLETVIAETVRWPTNIRGRPRPRRRPRRARRWRQSQMQRMDPGFKEKQLGYKSCTDFVQAHPEVIEARIDESGHLRLRRYA